MLNRATDAPGYSVSFSMYVQANCSLLDRGSSDVNCLKDLARPVDDLFQGLMLKTIRQRLHMVMDGHQQRDRVDETEGKALVNS